MSKDLDTTLDTYSQDPEVFLPLTPAEFHILLALAGNGMHGYRIMQEIAERTSDRMRIGPATLYRSLRRLLDAALIEETKDRASTVPDDERRRYYRLTPLGRQVARAEVERLKELISEAYRKDIMYDYGASVD